MNGHSKEIKKGDSLFLSWKVCVGMGSACARRFGLCRSQQFSKGLVN